MTVREPPRSFASRLTSPGWSSPQMYSRRWSPVPKYTSRLRPAYRWAAEMASPHFPALVQVASSVGTQKTTSAPVGSG